LASAIAAPSPPYTEKRVELWINLIQPWAWFIKNSTPLFTLMEGFCTLLFLQTAGRLSSWLVRKSDSWIIAQLLGSSCAFSTSMYFLYRIYKLPINISLFNAALICLVLTSTTIVALYGIMSRRGNTVESSLLFSYIVYCLYFTFTDFQSTLSASSILYFFTAPSPSDIPALPPLIINSYTSIASTIAAYVPAGFKTVFHFFKGTVSTVTPSVFVSLSYRLLVLLAATRIVLVVHKVSRSRRNSNATLCDMKIQPVALPVDEPIQSEFDCYRDADRFNDVFYDDDSKTPEYGQDYEDDEDFIEASNVDDDDYNSDDETCTDLDINMLHQKLESIEPHAPKGEAPFSIHSGKLLEPLQHKPKSKYQAIQFVVMAYAPCLLIAVYTHLLVQHMSLFSIYNQAEAGTLSASTSTVATTATVGSIAKWSWLHGWADPRDSWQFWGWINMFTTLIVYTLELVYGQKGNPQEIIG
jgi:hypothetical protein